MEIVLWIIGTLALIIIGAVVVAKWIFRKGRKGYVRGRDAIRDRRDRNRE